MSRLSASIEESANASPMPFPLGLAPQVDNPLELPHPEAFPSLSAMPPHFPTFDLWHSEKLFKDVIPIIETQKRRIKDLEGQLQHTQTQLSIHKNQRVSELNEMARVKSLFDRVLRDTLDIVRHQNDPNERERAIVMAGYTANLALVLMGSLPSPPEEGLRVGNAANEDMAQAFVRDHSECSTCQTESTSYSIHLPSTPIYSYSQGSNLQSPGDLAYAPSHSNSRQLYDHQPLSPLSRESLPQFPTTSLFRSSFDWNSSRENSDSGSPEFRPSFPLPYISPPQHTREEIAGPGSHSFAHLFGRPSRPAPLSPFSNFSMLRGNPLGQEPPLAESNLESGCECNDWNPYNPCLCSTSPTYEHEDVPAQADEQRQCLSPFPEPGWISRTRVPSQSPACLAVSDIHQTCIYDGFCDHSGEVGPKRKRASTSELDQSPESPCLQHRLVKQENDTGARDWSPALKHIKLESASP